MRQPVKEQEDHRSSGLSRSLEALFGQSTLSIAIIDIKHCKTIWASSYSEMLFKSTPSEICTHIDREVIRDEIRIQNWVQHLDAKGPITNKELIFLTAEGGHIVSLTNVGLAKFEEIECLIFSFTDITERKQAEAEMCHDAEADKFLGNVSGKLLGLNMEHAIFNAIENLGAFLHLDRINAQPIGIDSHAEKTYSWPRLQTVKLKGLSNIPLEAMPWLEAKLLNGETVSISDSSLLPSEATTLSALFKNYDIKSALISPILINDILAGYMSLEMALQPREWSASETAILIHMSNLIGSGIARSRAEKEMQSTKQRAEKSLADLENAQAQLLEAERMAGLGDLVAGVAHETNTPLGVAVTTSSAMRARLKNLHKEYNETRVKKSTLEDYFNFSLEGFEILEENLRRSAEIIQNFKQVALDVSHSSLQEINLKNYIESVLASLFPRTKRFKSIEIETNFYGDMNVFTEPGALSQIITHIIVNALIHAFDNDVSAQGKIEINVTQIMNEIQFVFSDTGKGMSEEKLEQLFDPYFTANIKKGESGLGMLVIHDFATRILRGSINVESQPESGTSFMLTIPARVDLPVPDNRLYHI